MITTDQIERLLSGGTVVSQGGEKIGKVGQVFLDDRSGEPEWVTVKTGLFGTGESFVPLSDADVQGDEIRVPFDKDRVKGAPRVDDSEGHLSPEGEAELYRYYGRAQAGAGDDRSGTGDQDDRHGESDADRHDEQDRHGDDAGDRPHEAGAVGRHAAGPATDDASATSDDDRAGRVRLRRYVVTEYETRTVPTEQSGTEGQGFDEERKVSERVREEIIEGEDDRP
jgi:sporulation protein YlmC with PRC-barrel domain